MARNAARGMQPQGFYVAVTTVVRHTELFQSKHLEGTVLYQALAAKHVHAKLES